MQRLWRLFLALLVFPIVLGACTLYSSSFGSASLDPQPTYNAIFVINHSFSQYLNGQIFFTDCNGDWNCFSTLVGPSVNDPIGGEAIVDCDALTIHCGYDGTNAMYGRTFVNPGGYPDPTVVDRCLYFGVGGPISSIWDENNRYFAYGSWGWLRPGSWTC